VPADRRAAHEVNSGVALKSLSDGEFSATVRAPDVEPCSRDEIPPRISSRDGDWCNGFDWSAKIVNGRSGGG
jgi:hypothetical protein